MAQKSILSIIQTVASEFNLPQPSIVVSSTDPNVLKLLAFARAVNDDLLAEHDWQELQTRHTFTTVDGTATYAFPTDIKRWISGTFFDTTNRWELVGPLSPRQWEWLLTWNTESGPFERLRIYNNLIHLYPTPDAAYTMVAEYISSFPVFDGSTGEPKADYTQDSDVCRFDHRLVVYGIKLKWLASIGQDTTAALSDYKRSLEFAKGSDMPAPRISLVPNGRFPFISNANLPDGNWVL